MAKNGMKPYRMPLIPGLAPNAAPAMTVSALVEAEPERAAEEKLRDVAGATPSWSAAAGAGERL